ncbi:MAG: hydroxymethylglutaryl-CoA lyase [Desulfobacterales bacterium]|nr:hydroxymethylglutaryl-CoA lyase [Desulfobacterales bacterium]
MAATIAPGRKVAAGPRGLRTSGGAAMLKIVEVGPRDGLQNETATVPVEAKVAFVDALSAAGPGEIEVSAFVAPHRVPQLADADEVLRRIARRPGVVYSALVPNRRGFERALAAGVDKIAVFTAVSETFNQHNINTSLAGSLRRFQPVIRRARENGLPVRGYLSAAFWCAFEGRIPPEATIQAAQRLADLGVDEIAISDTIGKATPAQVARLLDGLLSRIPIERIAVHFHDTYGHGVENVLKAYEFGIRIVDASVGGLGGCPFAPGASGNVATEAVIAALSAEGATIEIDPEELGDARRLLDPYLGTDRRPQPVADLPICAACDHFTDVDCCDRKAATG